MKEALKGTLLNRGECYIGDKKAYKYLIGMVLITDKPIDDINDTQEVIIVYEKSSNKLTDILSDCRKFVPESPLGDLDQAILEVSNMPYSEIIVLPNL